MPITTVTVVVSVVFVDMRFMSLPLNNSDWPIQLERCTDQHKYIHARSPSYKKRSTQIQNLYLRTRCCRHWTLSIRIFVCLSPDRQNRNRRPDTNSHSCMRARIHIIGLSAFTPPPELFLSKFEFECIISPVLHFGKRIEPTKCEEILFEFLNHRHHHHHCIPCCLWTPFDRGAFTSQLLHVDYKTHLSIFSAQMV